MTDNTNIEEKPKLNVEGVYELLEDPETHALVLVTILLVQYGDHDDLFLLDPLLIEKWLSDDFGISELNEFNRNKIAAAFTVLGNTSYFYQDLEIFKSVCKTLFTGDTGVYDVNMFNSNPTVPEILWGIYEVGLLLDDNAFEKSEFSYAIKTFIDTILNHTGEDITINENTHDVIRDNSNDIREQLIKIGVTQIPIFPTLEINV